MRLLTSALDPARDLPFMMIATGRSDVLEGLVQAGDLAQLTDTFPLPLMPLDRVPRLVEGPAAVAGINVEKGLAERIARDVESAEALPLLAHTLWLLYRRGGDDKKLSIAEYEALGDPQRGFNPIQNSVRLVADQVIAGLRPAEPELAALRDAFVPHLVRIRLEDGKRVRQPARMAELPPDSLRLLRALVQARLLTARGADRTDADRGESLVEVTHEALFKAWPDLDRWLTEEQAFLLDLERIRSAHEVWSQAPAEQKSHALLHGLLLTRARDWMLRYPQRFLGRDLEPLRAYIAASAAAEDADKQRAAAEEARTRRMERMLFRGAIAATLVLAVLAAGAGVAAWIAVKNEARAARNFELTIDQADALVTKLSTELKDRIGISQDVIRRVLGLIENQIDALAKADERSPRLAVSRANMLSAFAENYIELGDLEQARSRAQECVDIVRPLQRQAGKDAGTDIDAPRALAGCLGKLANALATRSLFTESIKAYQESAGLRRGLLAADPGNTALQAELSNILTYYAYALMNVGRLDEAYDRAREGLAISASLVQRDPGNALWRREYIDSLNALAMVLDDKGELPAALEAFAEAARIGRMLVDEDAGNATLRRFFSNILANYSDTLFKGEKKDQALLELTESVDVKRRLHAADAGNATWEYELSVALTKLGRSQFALEKPEALDSLREARDRFKSLLLRDPGNALYRWGLIDALATMAFVNNYKGDAQAARALAEECLAVIEDMAGGDSTDQIMVRIKETKGNVLELIATLPPR
jgi:tetratricopeptide (TPR) repeat protein